MRVERRRNLPKAAKVLNLLSLFVDWIEKEDDHIDRKAYLKTSLNVNSHCCCCFRCCQEELPQSTFFPITPTHPECFRRELFPWATHPPYHVSFTIHATVVCPDWEVYLVEFVLVELKNYVDWIIHTHVNVSPARGWRIRETVDRWTNLVRLRKPVNLSRLWWQWAWARWVQ